MRSVNLTPAAFDKNNPKAQANIAKSLQGAKLLERVISQKADFLRHLVESFGGIEGVVVALRKMAQIDHHVIPDEVKEIIAEVRTTYLQLEKEHDDAGKMLIEALRGE